MNFTFLVMISWWLSMDIFLRRYCPTARQIFRLRSLRTMQFALRKLQNFVFNFITSINTLLKRTLMHNFNCSITIWTPIHIVSFIFAPDFRFQWYTITRSVTTIMRKKNLNLPYINYNLNFLAVCSLCVCIWLTISIISCNNLWFQFENNEIGSAKIPKWLYYVVCLINYFWSLKKKF